MLNARSFKTKLTLSYIFVVLFSFSFLAFFLDKSLEEKSLQDVKGSLINQTSLIQSRIIPGKVKEGDLVYLGALAADVKARINARLTIINNSGRVLADSDKSSPDVLAMENHAERPEVRLALSGAEGVDIRYSTTLKINMLYAALPIKEKSEVVGAVRLALALSSIEKILFEVRKTVFLGLFFAVGLAFLLGSVLASGIVKPVNRIIHISRKFTKGDFSQRIFQHSRDEIGELALTLNKMAQEIEDKIKETNIQNQQLKAVFNSMIEGVIVVNRAGHIISINPAIEKIFNISARDVEGKLFLEAIRNNNITDVINEVLNKASFLSEELVLAWPVQRIFQVNAAPIFEKESVSGCLIVIHDVTEIRRLENMRRDFVANVSHELRTPLTSIKGFVETLLEGAIDDKENSRNFLRIIQDHAERLNNLVNDLLDLSHIESKTAQLEVRELRLRELVDEVLSGFSSQINKKVIVVKNELLDSVVIKADKDKISQVLTNLIDNAMKFNRDKGYVRIYAEEDADKMKVVVEDSGTGIPEKDLARIFERFYRVDKARSRELGGTGLGLSIVKHIVELHAGTVGVESTEGLGSKFWFILPK